MIQPMNEAAELSARKVSRAKLLGLMGLYAAPLIAAWFWFAYVSSNEGAGAVSYTHLTLPTTPYV